MWTLDEIVEHTNIPKTTVFRLMKTYEDTGVVQKVSFYHNGYTIEGHVYQFGIRLMELGHLAASGSQNANHTIYAKVKRQIIVLYNS